MKTLIKPLLVAFSLLLANVSASQAQATQAPSRPQSVTSFQSGIFTTVDGKLQIALDKQVGEIVEIRLANAAGQVFFTQRVTKRQTTARLRLDVSALPDGAYQLAITNSRDTTRQALTLDTKQPQEPNRLVALN